MKAYFDNEFVHTASFSFPLQAHQLLMNFEEPLKDYVRAVQSVKVSLISNLIYVCGLPIIWGQLFS